MVMKKVAANGQDDDLVIPRCMTPCVSRSEAKSSVHFLLCRFVKAFYHVLGFEWSKSQPHQQNSSNDAMKT